MLTYEGVFGSVLLEHTNTICLRLAVLANITLTCMFYGEGDLLQVRKPFFLRHPGTNKCTPKMFDFGHVPDTPADQAALRKALARRRGVVSPLRATFLQRVV